MYHRFAPVPTPLLPASKRESLARRFAIPPAPPPYSGYDQYPQTRQLPMGEYGPTRACRKDLVDVLPGCFTTFYGVRRV